MEERRSTEIPICFGKEDWRTRPPAHAKPIEDPFDGVWESLSGCMIAERKKGSPLLRSGGTPREYHLWMTGDGRYTEIPYCEDKAWLWVTFFTAWHLFKLLRLLEERSMPVCRRSINRRGKERRRWPMLCVNPVSADHPDGEWYDFNTCLPVSLFGLRANLGKFQIFVKTVSGKSMLLWISAEDTGESLKTLIVQKGGFSPDSFYLLREGKVVNKEDKLRSHQIYLNSTIHMVYRLRGGSNGNRGAVGPSSYRDAARPKGPLASETLPPSQPKPYIVEKSEDIPSLEIKNTEVRKLFRSFQKYALICRFNGFWPRSYDIHKWIHSFWTTNCEILLCSKGFLVVQFDLKEDYQKTIEQGPWFWGRAGLFLTPWFPEFDANTMVVTKMPIWVRLPNLPIPFWHKPMLEDIGNLLGKFIKNDTAQQDQGLYTYARICVEIDLSKGLPDRIQLKYEKYKWIQVLDYENTAFRCRYCHQTGHLQDSCPIAKRFPKKKKGMNTKGKTWQADYDPSSDGDSDIEENEPEDPQKDESNEENQKKAESEEAQQTDPKSASNDPHTGNMQIMTTSLSGSKRTHESENLESDKEKPSGQPPVDCKELVVADPQEGGWTKVKSKKKEKKGKLEDYFSLYGN